MKKVYYAHFMGIYNTPQEERDIKTLTDLGLEVINPNTPEIQKEFNDYPLNCPEGSYQDRFDIVFNSRVKECEVFAFRPLPDGKIPNGIAMELKTAIKNDIIIIELPCATYSRTIDKDATREYLQNIGQR